MKKNPVQKVINSFAGTWTAPAGVTQVTVTILDNFDKLSAGGPKTGSCLKADGSAWAWGYNQFGGLGDGTVIAKSSPVAVIGGHSFIEIFTSSSTRSSGGSRHHALKADGSVWSWGISTSGGLGDGTTINKSSPVPVIGGHSFVSIGVGDAHSVALKADGSVWSWGENGQGQLGDGTIIAKSSPVPVIGGHSFVSIGAGNCHSLALKADGSAWAWGNNSNNGATGALGDDTTIHKSSPVAVIGGHSFISIAGGYANTIALKADGSAWAWGGGFNGGLGTGNSIARSSPVAVIGGHSFVSIGVGAYHSVGIKSNGSAWAWGSNGQGELGDGTIANKSSPVPVIGGHSFVSIGASSYYTLALKSDGSVWSWGDNSSGTLGDNTLVDKSSPVAVIGGHRFQPNQNFVNKYTISVTPGTVYNFNSIQSQIGQKIIANNIGNNLILILEYYA